MKENTLIGLFAEGHLEYDIEREEIAPHQPSLAEMTEVAIKKLSENPNGFYLFVEAGKIGKNIKLSYFHLFRNAYLRSWSP